MSLTSAPPLLDDLLPDRRARALRDNRPRAAPLVLDTACQFDMQRLWLVRVICRMREVVIRTPATTKRTPQGILADTLSLGWGLLHRDERRVIVGPRLDGHARLG